MEEQQLAHSNLGIVHQKRGLQGGSTRKAGRVRGWGLQRCEGSAGRRGSGAATCRCMHVGSPTQPSPAQPLWWQAAAAGCLRWQGRLRPSQCRAGGLPTCSSASARMLGTSDLSAAGRSQAHHPRHPHAHGGKLEVGSGWGVHGAMCGVASLGWAWPGVDFGRAMRHTCLTYSSSCSVLRAPELVGSNALRSSRCRQQMYSMGK